MPIARFILPDLGIAVFRYAGDVTVEENVDAFLGYAKSEAFDPNLHVLVDQENCTLSQATYSEMWRLAYLLRPYYEVRGTASRTAFFSPGDVPYGVTRSYDAASQQYVEREIGIFRTRHEVAAYLDLDPSDPDVMRAIWPNWAPLQPGED